MRRMAIFYVLDSDHNVIPAEPTDQNNRRAADWLFGGSRGGEQHRRVALTKLDNGRVSISTVFLGIDHNFSMSGPPIVFETMVFAKDIAEGFTRRYATWAEAEAGHAEVVEEVRKLLEVPNIGV